MVNDSFSKLSYNNQGVPENNNTVDVGLWKNMIFYKSIVNVKQQNQRLSEHNIEQLKNHYANIPSKIKSYIRKPIKGYGKSKSRSKSKDNCSINQTVKPNQEKV